MPFNQSTQSTAPQFPSNERLRTRIEGFYLGTPNLSQKFHWTWNSQHGGNILTEKATAAPAILHGVFFVSGRPFRMYPDANFNSDHKPEWATGMEDEIAMARTPAWMLLRQVPDPTILGHTDFTKYFANIHDFEELAKPLSTTDSTLSSSENNIPGIRLSHKMFNVGKRPIYH